MTTQREKIFTELGWRWRRVNNSSVAHLVPGNAGKGSRTACNTLSVPRADILTMPVSLLMDVPLCVRCVRVLER